MDGSFFGFKSRPFGAAPAVETYFPAQTIERSRQTLIRVIQRAEGPGLIIGAAGVGKSMLCQLLAAFFRESFDVVTLSSARICSRKALLQNILFELNLPYRDLEEGELRLALLDFLQPGQSNPNGLLLLIDEAHALPMRLLDELRMITNLVRDGQPRARLVLAGNPKLDERFTHPKLESFNQRLAARCYLEPLTHDETIHYVRSQINSAGGDPDSVFSEDALEAIYRASDGVPRLVNQVCDHALLLASAGGRRKLDAAGVDEAWADLQQLPAPWYNHDDPSQDESIVEYGSLEEELGPTETDEQESPAAKPSVVLSQPVTEPDAVLDQAWEDPTPRIRIADATTETVSVAATPGLVPPAAEDNDGQQIVLSWPRQHLSDSVADEDTGDRESCNRDPFGHDFEEEEVVIDRYASLELEAFRNCPQVIGDESLELALALAPTIVPVNSRTALDIRGPAEPAPVNEGALAVNEASTVDEPAVAREPVETTDAVQHPVAAEPLENRAPTAPLAATPQPAPETDIAHSFEYTVLETGLDQSVAEVMDTLQTPIVLYDDLLADAAALQCQSEPTGPAASQVDDDRDLMVVENERRTPAEDVPSRTPPEAQGQEYHQLFAQLRKS